MTDYLDVQLSKAVCDTLRTACTTATGGRVYLAYGSTDFSSITKPFIVVEHISQSMATMEFQRTAEALEEEYVFWVKVFCRTPEEDDWEWMELPIAVKRACLNGFAVYNTAATPVLQDTIYPELITSDFIKGQHAEDNLNYCTVLTFRVRYYRAKNSDL